MKFERHKNSRLWYRNPNHQEWEWFYDCKPGPAVSLPANRWRSLINYCEDLYIARIPLIRPLVPSRAEAFIVSAALVWNGFVLNSAKREGARSDPIPVYFRGRNPDRPIETDDDLWQYLREAWADAYLCWLPRIPGIR